MFCKVSSYHGLHVGKDTKQLSILINVPCGIEKLSVLMFSLSIKNSTPEITHYTIHVPYVPCAMASHAYI